MGDEATFSDDISALWGPNDKGFFEPAPARRTDQPGDVARGGHGDGGGEGTTGGSPASIVDRVTAVEDEVKALAGAVEALRSALDVLPAIQTGLSGSEERLEGVATAMEDARDALRQRLTALERDVQEGLAKLAAAIEAKTVESVGEHQARNVGAEVREAFTAELGAMRAALEEVVERRVSEAENTLYRRLDDLSTQVVAATDAAERLAATERRTALLAESVEAYRRETTRDPDLEAIRADLQAAADEITARTDERLTQQLHDLAAHLTHVAASDRGATEDRVSALEQRIIRVAELVESHRVQSVMGWELESLRTELTEAVRALAARTEMLGAMASNEAEEERRRLEASWQQSMPGF